MIFRLRGKLKGSRGSVMVESAMVFPLALLVVFLFIFTALEMYGSVRSDAEYHKSVAGQESIICPETTLRARWLISKGFKKEAKDDE